MKNKILLILLGLCMVVILYLLGVIGKSYRLGYDYAYDEIADKLIKSFSAKLPQTDKVYVGNHSEILQ